MPEGTAIKDERTARKGLHGHSFCAAAVAGQPGILSQLHDLFTCALFEDVALVFQCMRRDATSVLPILLELDVVYLEKFTGTKEDL